MTKLDLAASEIPMQLRYGFNGRDNWRYFELGSYRELMWARLREMGTRIIRIFLFGKDASVPVKEWDQLVGYVRAVLNVGGTSMFTFAKVRFTCDPRAVRWFAYR